MKQHQYHITVQHLKDAKGEVSTYTERLEFYTGNHDDIFEIVEKLKNAEFFDDQTTKSFAVGLKLFRESRPSIVSRILATVWAIYEEFKTTS